MAKDGAYACVSTSKQTTNQQVAALQVAGCFTEKMSGKRNDRPQLPAAPAALEPGDTLTVWKLDRLGRNPVHQCSGSPGGAKPKLDDEQADAGRRAHANGESVAALACVHHVSRPTIYRMLEGVR